MSTRANTISPLLAINGRGDEFRLRGRPAIDSLPLPSRRFDLNAVNSFETELAASIEDSERARRLRSQAGRNQVDSRHLRNLADRIDPENTSEPDTVASSRYMRAQRRRIFGALWELLDSRQIRSCGPASRPNPCTFHVIVENSSEPLDRLLDFNARAYMGRFRSHLYRVARNQLGGMPPGLLFAALHGAYDPNTQTFPIHIHGVATDGKIAAVDLLRSLPMYEPAAAGDGRDAALNPVWMAAQPLVNMPDPITYIMKSFWPLRPTLPRFDGLRRAVRVKVRRITHEPAHSEYLRFLDKWRLNDLTLIMGMHVANNRLSAH